MFELCLMASHGYPPGIVFHPEQTISRVSKDFLPFWHDPISRQDVIRSGSFCLRPHQVDDPWKLTSSLTNMSNFLRTDPTMKKPVLIDVHDTHPNSILFSLEIAEKCNKHEKILHFLMSGSTEVEGGGLDLAMLSDLMGIQALTSYINEKPYVSDYGSFLHGAEVQSSLVYPLDELYSQKPLLEYAVDFTHKSEVMLDTDHRVTPNGASTEMKDILSIIAEYYLSKDSTRWRKRSLLVPHFDRLDNTEAGAKVLDSTLVHENVNFAPLKSPEKTKLKSLPKKKINKKARERDLYKKNYFHACESLLSILMDKKHNGKTAIISLKKSGPELPQLLTQFSASIAGTGIAVIFSVVCKVACGRVPFCMSKLFNTSIGFGLVWLSWAVNRLRDTVISISRSSGKKGLREDKLTRKLDRCVNEIFFRAATLMAVAVLRLV